MSYTIRPIEARDDASVASIIRTVMSEFGADGGAGRAVIERCLAGAHGLGFRRCYIETLTGMDAAQKLYLANGFRRIARAGGG